jgi:hypothetical protein
VNARIGAVNDRFGVSVGTYQVLCECGAESCLQRIEVPSEVFTELRDDRARFVVAPGHEASGADEVVAETGSYSIVEVQPMSRPAKGMFGALAGTPVPSAAQ